MPSRRIRLAAALVLVPALAVLAGGCRRSSRHTTVVGGAGIFTTDDFPGDAVQAGNVADDQRAMSPSGDGFSGQLRVVLNGDRGTAMVLYRGASGFAYAHYFDGASWTPPVALTAVDADLTAVQVSATCVAFLNTGDHASDLARERDGDAVILWTAPDVADGGADGENLCLFSTYFNASARDDAGANHGFQAQADRVSNLEDGEVPPFAEDVYVFGLVSDGLCGEARWSVAGPQYGWGDATTGLAAFWLQIQDNEPAVAGMQMDWYLAYATWDLAQPGDPELPLVPSADARAAVLGFGASDSGVTSEETMLDVEFVSYNATVFYRLSSRADPGSLAGYTPASNPFWGSLDAGTDVTIQAITFDLATGAPHPAVALGLSTPSSLAADGFQSNAAFTNHGGMFGGGFETSRHSVYGADEGLARTAVYTLSLASDDDTTFGEIVADGRLLLSEIDPDTGAVLDAVAIDGEDPDIADSVTTDVSSRISRNGDYVWAAWHEPVDMAPTGPSADDHYGIWVGEYLPARLEDDGSVPASIPPLSERTHSALRASPDVTGGFSAASGFQFQSALGYVCGVQSDPDVMNLFFEHSNAASDEFHLCRLTADLDPAGGLAPSVVTTPFESFPEGTFGILAFSDDTPSGFIAADSGEGGNVIAFYVNDADPGPGTDWRVFARRTGLGAGVVEIDSDTPEKQVLFPTDTLRVAVTPPGSDIGRFDPATGEDDGERPHPASDVHVFFHESRFHEADGLTPAIRTRRFRAGDTGLALAESFVPTAGAAFEPPFEITVLAAWVDSIYPTIDVPLVAGDRVGLFFADQDHVYYQEYDPDGDDGLGWHNDGGAPDPFLVDDDSSETIVSPLGAARPSCSCDTLHGAMVFWSKNFGGSSVNRLQVRVRSMEE